MTPAKVIIRNFKRFWEAEFIIPPSGVVVAGPNNAGKTTLLQAIAAWSLGLRRWLEMGDLNSRNGYVKAPLARQAFYSVPLINFNALWHGAKPRQGSKLEIHITFNGGGLCGMEFLHDTTEQVYVRPTLDTNDLLLLSMSLGQPNIVFVPAMSGIVMEEPLYQPAKISQLLGQGRPGDVLRNLLAQVGKNTAQWEKLSETVNRIFGYRIKPVDDNLANIRAEYTDKSGTTLDIAAAGSGFLQVLMLLSFLSTQSDAILLLDEPDAHLHILLQDRIYRELQAFARESNSTLIMATHSERIIQTTEPRKLCVLLDKPQLIADEPQRNALITSLSAINNTDIMLAQDAPGVLYVEGYTDINILREWARILEHPLLDFLQEPFWKPSVQDSRESGIRADRHFDALRLANPDIAGIELHDSDGHERGTDLRVLQNGLVRHYWQRYEIESYLLHPDAIVTFVKQMSGQQEAADTALAYMKDNFPPAIIKEPTEEHEYLKATKAKTILANIFQEAGIQNFSDYSLLAASMLPEQLPAEVKEKLDVIANHFKISDTDS